MFAPVVSLTLAGASAIPVAVKAVGELHRMTVLQSNGNNTLARQGAGTPAKSGEAAREARRRTGGLSNGPKSSDPSYMGQVPNRPLSGDLREDYKVGGLGNATSSKGNIVDILDSVPRRTQGTPDYKRSARPQPSRQAGFGNQSFTP